METPPLAPNNVVELVPSTSSSFRTTPTLPWSERETCPFVLTWQWPSTRISHHPVFPRVRNDRARPGGSPSIINVLSEIATSTAGTQAASCSRRCGPRSIKEANDELVIRRSFWLSNEPWLLN